MKLIYKLSEIPQLSETVHNFGIQELGCALQAWSYMRTMSYMLYEKSKMFAYVR